MSLLEHREPCSFIKVEAHHTCVDIYFLFEARFGDMKMFYGFSQGCIAFQNLPPQ